MATITCLPSHIFVENIFPHLNLQSVARFLTVCEKIYIDEMLQKYFSTQLLAAQKIQIKTVEEDVFSLSKREIKLITRDWIKFKELIDKVSLIWLFPPSSDILNSPLLIIPMIKSEENVKKVIGEFLELSDFDLIPQKSPHQYMLSKGLERFKSVYKLHGGGDIDIGKGNSSD